MDDDGSGGGVPPDREDESARDRSRRRWRTSIDRRSTKLGDQIRALAEAGVTVAVTTVDGAVHRGMVTGAGADAAVVVTGAGTVVIPLAAVASLRSPPVGGAGPMSEAHRDERDGDVDAATPPGPLLLDVLDALAAERAEVSVAIAEGHRPLTARLEWVGEDVLGLLLGGGDQVLVPLPSLRWLLHTRPS